MDIQVYIGFHTKRKMADIVCTNWDCRIFYKCLDSRYIFDPVNKYHLDMNHNICLCRIYVIIGKICNKLNSSSHNNQRDIFDIGLRYHFYRTQ